VPLSFASLAKTADPGVVTIISRIEEQRPGGRRRVVGEGLGTGFVYDKSGLVLTNNHVIEDGTEISVKLADGRELPAKIVGRDKPADVAVVRVEDKALFPLALGDSDAIDVGDWVVAIGNPFGLSHTVSAGILSAKGRTHDDVKGLDPSGYFNFLQTDAAINQGNSGGPLLNLKGEVVGINAAIRANANNIGFAIPINMVKELLPILIREGKVTRSQLGLVVDPVNETEAQRLRRTDHKGAWIKSVIPGSGAERAGLAPDDVVLRFEGKTVTDPNQLRWLASLAGVGKTVTMRVQRADKVFEVKVTLSALQSPPDDDEGPPRMPPLTRP
jgi:serine protease Do